MIRPDNSYFRSDSNESDAPKRSEPDLEVTIRVRDLDLGEVSAVVGRIRDVLPDHHEYSISFTHG